MPHWTKIALKIFSGIVGLLLLIYIAVAIYVHLNKEKLLVTITHELNKNLNGKLTINSMEPSFLTGFPGASLNLSDVSLQDSLYKQHRHHLLKAKKLIISVNALGLLRGMVEIRKITISNAVVYLYTDSNGYTNTSIFRSNENITKDTSKDTAPPRLRRFSIDNVKFIVDNRKGHKLFDFEVMHLSGKIDYPGSGWRASFKVKTLVKSLAFNTDKGSFMKDKMLEGPFLVHYNKDDEAITVDPKEVRIGQENFIIGAKFYTKGNRKPFAINIRSDQILWKNAYALLTPNISEKLELFDLKNPISVNCNLKGNFALGGNPYINVGAMVRNNVLEVPGGTIKQCNFDGAYNNYNHKGLGFNDENSVVKLYHFTGLHQDIPFKIDTAMISNFKRPVASGIFESEFDISKLNRIIGPDLIKFNSGKAAVHLAYKADVVNFQLSKPYVQGSIDIKDAGLEYVPRGLKFQKTAISLVFTENDLLIKNLRLQSGKSIVFMEGSIKNFLNLYYSAPEKILLSWDIKSPQLYLGEFFGFLSQRKPVTVKTKSKSGSTFSENLNMAFESSRVALNLSVDKVYYNRFLATNAKAELDLSQNGITIKNVVVHHAGGLLKLNGSLSPRGQHNTFAVNAIISNVDIKKFFYSFKNFGLTTLTSENLNGYLFAKTKISGVLNENGVVLKNSINGQVIFDFKKGQLLNFEPINNVGVFAFPLRDFNNIRFRNLNGKFDINGDIITINPMKINSNVLNMDVAGIYSLGKGTSLALDIPLRNPKKDVEIDDPEEKAQKRMKGIVLHILATDGEDGKIKFKWNKNHD